MPVSGSEETGARSTAPLSTGYGAGVPIKKRRFPFVRPPSLPLQEPSLEEKSDGQRKEEFATSLQGFVLPNVNAAAEHPGSCDSNKVSVTLGKLENSQMEESKTLKANDGSISAVEQGSLLEKADSSEKGIYKDSAVKVEEASSSYEEGSKEKTVKDENHVEENRTAGTSGLQLSPDDFCHLKAKEGSCVNIAVERDERSRNLLTSSEIDAGLPQPKDEEACMEQDKLEDISLNLSLSDGKGSQSTGEVKRSSSDVSDVVANRSNWDLNTTMDAWEDSFCDSACVKNDSFCSEMNATDGENDSKPSTQPVASPLSENLVESQCGGACDESSRPVVDMSTYESSLNLGLQTSFLQSNLSHRPLTSPPRLDQGANLISMLASSSRPNEVASSVVKSEPVDEPVKQSFGDEKIQENVTVKCESYTRDASESLESSISNTTELVNPRSIKAELGCENREASGSNAEASGRSIEQIRSGCELLPKEGLAMEINHMLETESCHSESGKDGGSVGKSGHLSKGDHHEGILPQLQETSENVVKPDLNNDSFSAGSGGSDLRVSSLGSMPKMEDGSVLENVQSVIKPVNTTPSPKENNEEMDKTTVIIKENNKGTDRTPPSLKENEETVSDGEKFEISACMEEDGYGSEYDSDGNHASMVAADAERIHREDNEYEDGEVREQILLTDVGTDVTQPENVSNQEPEHIGLDFSRNSSCQPAPSLSAEENARLVHGEMNEACLEEFNADNAERVQESTDDHEHSQHSSLIEVVATDPEYDNTVKVLQGRAVDGTTTESPSKDLISDQSSCHTIKVEAVIATVTHGVGDDPVKTDNLISSENGDQNDTVSPKVDASLNYEIDPKDGNSEGNRRRIINLSRPTNVSSPDKVRSISDRTLSSRAGRKRLPDIALEGDRPHLRGRDDFRDDDFNKFSRDRDIFTRNSRSNFARDRGRVSSGIGGNWDEQELGSKTYDGPPVFRGARYKYGSDYRNYNAASDGVVGTGRGGRKVLTDGGPNFRHMSSRRHSPGSRDGPALRGLSIVGGVPRNLSPTRCVDVDDPDMIGLRHGNKFIRDYSDDMFACPRASYGEDEGFVGGERNITSFKSKVIHRFRSKSPVRLRSRSPILWSPRRRTPEGFGGHPQLTHRRSPAVYRRDRMRSPPDRSCFRGEMMIRRQNSPPYMSQTFEDLREMSSGRDHGFPRPIMPNRSPSGRISMRNRRNDIVNSRERAHNEYFRVPIRTSRFHDIGGDGESDERRRLGEKRAPIRHFKPPYTASEESFVYSTDEASRPYRLCQEDDSVYHERGNSREAQLDRRNKNRAGDSQKARTVEEQEGNFRHSGLCDEFEDPSRTKRKRFQ